MSYAIACVHCQAVLKSATPVPAGRKVTCPKCNQAFTTPSNDVEPAKGFSIQCIHCQAVLKSPTAVPAGKKVTCPKCSQAFTTPGAAPAPAPSLAPAKPVAKAPLNISIFTGDADAAIAHLADEPTSNAPAPTLDDDLVTEEDVIEIAKRP